MRERTISDSLQLFNLNESKINLSKIENRRFMFHPSGYLILGAEDMVNSSDGLYKSHAEEYDEACERYDLDLPSYDDFTRGWIGVGGDYPKGIIHFAPSIDVSHIPSYNAAFDFVEAAIQNGFSKESTLRGFGKPWEQTITKFLGEETEAYTKNCLDDIIKRAEENSLRSISRTNIESIPHER